MKRLPCTLCIPKQLTAASVAGLMPSQVAQKAAAATLAMAHDEGVEALVDALCPAHRKQYDELREKHPS